MTLIFDIGKTNKKAFLFDKAYQEVYRKYARFEELTDADGFPCDDLSAIEQWIKKTIQTIFKSGKHEVNAINFSTYGASFIHLGRDGKPLTPIYNYLKSIPQKYLQEFYYKYGHELNIAQETASPPLGMLNSGLQLYWLKYAQPDLFSQIWYSLHFPQYLSYLLTGIPVSEYTSIGCHTALWNFAKKDYHDWVYAEGIDKILPPIISTATSINTKVVGKKVQVGVGIHDSSAALLPYLKTGKKPFLLISTGTWSISLNPFNQESLTETDLKEDCLNFMQLDGQPVKAARLFLGAEYKHQVNLLQSFFNQSATAHKQVAFNSKIAKGIAKKGNYYFNFEYLKTPWQQPKVSQLEQLADFEVAYHQLLWELVELQIAKMDLAIGKTTINKIFIDGGFADNEVYVKFLARHFKKVKIRLTQSPLGSALGAAMVITDEKLKKKFLKKNYALRKVD
ncbi:MAG: FGGY-family carbohydrate kinase [Saprospiraceae bacterium]